MTGSRQAQKISGTNLMDVLHMLSTEIELARAELGCDFPAQEDFVVNFAFSEEQPETQHIRVFVQLGGEQRQFFAECTPQDGVALADQSTA